MTPRQCEIAAESYSASLLARCGYDISVQYGANQPQYDLVAVKGSRIILVSVKGSQDGGWMLAVKHVGNGVLYHAAIDTWEQSQRKDLVFMMVQYMHASLTQAPPVYVARAAAIAAEDPVQWKRPRLPARGLSARPSQVQVLAQDPGRLAVHSSAH